MAKEKSISKKKVQKLISTTIQKSIAAHKEASEHLLRASKYHLEAVGHHQAGLHEKASHSGVLAHGHFSLAHDAMIENAKFQAMKNK
jgi:hypothetical protein